MAYQNSMESGQSGDAHADSFDHEYDISDYILSKNNIYMVKTIGVRGPTLAGLAMATSGEPSTWFPLG